MLAPLLLLLAPAEDPPRPLAPLDFLVGHCWKGEISADTYSTHCFERLDGDRVRDRHEVTEDGRVIHSGETIYQWDPAARQIAFTYSSGGRLFGKGHVRPIADGLDFGTVEYDPGPDPKSGRDPRITITSRWIRVGADAFETIESVPANPPFSNTTRYTRVSRAPRPLR